MKRRAVMMMATKAGVKETGNGKIGMLASPPSDVNRAARFLSLC